jgi:hypothetical protein
MAASPRPAVSGPADIDDDDDDDDDDQDIFCPAQHARIISESG